MKIFFLLALIILSSCSPKNYCSNKINYLVKVDTTKPYKLEGKYCIERIGKDKTLGDSVLMNFKVFSRITGAPIKNGIIIFNNITAKTQIINGVASKKIKPGKCNFGIEGFIGIPLGVNDLKFEPNTIVEINAYLGDSLQW